MLECYPASNCCCGFTVSFGVKAIAMMIFITSVGLLAWAVSQTFDWSHTGAQGGLVTMLIAGWCLAGLLFSGLGFYGAQHRSEVHVRLFLIFFFITFLVDLVVFLKTFILSGICNAIPGFLASQGAAFACGSMRWLAIISSITMISVQGYLAFILYSYCEDLAESGSGPRLWNLHDPEEERRAHPEAHSIEDKYGGLLNLQEWARSPGSIYDTTVSGGMGGQHIYGTYHELNYPPGLWKKAVKRG
mmetsp:Transcript_49445/g.115623  ORF Transcript_49445/g.115623 Transcript_49445/m.115623 type:complete len:245 (+) Transcript_49445:109-843(+)